MRRLRCHRTPEELSELAMIKGDRIDISVEDLECVTRRASRERGDVSVRLGGAIMRGESVNSSTTTVSCGTTSCVTFVSPFPRSGEPARCCGMILCAT